MAKKLLCSLLILFCFNVLAQKKGTFQVRFQSNENVVNPEFEGGLKAFYKYVSQNIAIGHVSENVTEIIKMRFTVDKEGKVTNIETIQDSKKSAYKFGKQLGKVLKKSPKWSPGTIDGSVSPVTLEIDIPIVIRMEYYLDDDS